MSAQEDRTGQTLKRWLRTFASAKRMAERAFVLVIRGWLIERARSKALREDLEEAVAMFEAYCEHWDGCPSKGLTHRNAKCDCGLRKDIETAKKWRRK